MTWLYNRDGFFHSALLGYPIASSQNGIVHPAVCDCVLKSHPHQLQLDFNGLPSPIIPSSSSSTTKSDNIAPDSSKVHNKGLSKKPLSAFRYRIWFSNFFVVTCFVTLCIFYSTGYIRDSLYYGGIFFALTCACFSSIFLVYGLWLSRKMKRIFGDENYKELGTKTRRGIRHRDGQEQIRKRLEWFAIVLSVFFCLKSGVWISASATGCPSIHKQHCHILYGVFYWCELCVMILNLRLFAPGVDKIVADAKYRRERKNGGKSRKRSPAAVTLRHARNCCDDASEIEDPMEDEETECKSGQCQTESESGDLPSGRERNSQEPLM
eukprot:jgi/Bigna1/136560/aug1.34_g11268